MRTKSSTRVESSDIVQLVSPSQKSIFVKMVPGGQLQTHRGVVQHDEIINRSYGETIKSHTGAEYIVLKPTLAELLVETPRNTQIMYPKDIGYVLLKLGIGIGDRVIEAGTGSGALTIALAWYVGEEGKIFSYDNRAEMQHLAKKNLIRLGLETRVELKVRDICDGFDEREADAAFLDLPNPYDYLRQVYYALKPGAPFGCILPTTNQVSLLLASLHNNNFEYIEVCEIMLRYYKPFYNRLRPTDRMVAHTGYLIFAHTIIKNVEASELSN